MPPIPVHKNAPIKPDGITPITASNTNEDRNTPAPTRTLPASVPATTTADAFLPPAPQPGARPIPPTQAASSSQYAPPPPQPSYTAHHITTSTSQIQPPPQFTHPPPSDSALAGRSTATSTTASKSGPTTLNMGPAASPYQPANAGGGVERRSLEHPPGYQQVPDNAPYAQGGGIGGHAGDASGSGERSGSSGEGVGAQAWNILSQAGEALKKGEEAAWRAMRNK
ncbi:hypothetical protein BDU57DRAFT_187820 [Ampelomyces quisqualis]|uniref:Uncharacterized protein n=1 Tax=Ampelomyces quisqualis TaxID=50730 RepID=A0A6A5QQU5_AMPQU|nr:hypothetical protein BDU57DRAFT_187820 [Ampelomyces quisqualis]